MEWPLGWLAFWNNPPNTTATPDSPRHAIDHVWPPVRSTNARTQQFNTLLSQNADMVRLASVKQLADRTLAITVVLLIAVVVAALISFNKGFQIEGLFFTICTVVAAVLVVGQGRELVTEY